MRIPSGDTGKYLYFVAVDATDFHTRETGISSTGFTVYRSRNGSTGAAYTTPTVVEVSTGMPGTYALLLDEDMTISAGNDSEEIAVHITQTTGQIAPVTRTFELYRKDAASGLAVGVVASTTGTSTVFSLTMTPAVVDADQFKGRIITFEDDTTTTGLRCQATDITANTTGGVFTVTALTRAPASGDRCRIS